METNCKNCERALVVDYDFCPGCGQKAHLHRLGLHELFHDAVHYFTHADKGLFQLLRDLVIKRGKVAREYAEGRRKKYFPPLNFFLIIAAVFVFSATFNQSKAPIDVLRAHPELSKIPDPVERADKIALHTRIEKSSRFVNSYSNVMGMCALPLSALIYFLCYIRGRYNYIEHLVAGMYLLGFCLLIYALVLLPITYLFDIPRGFAIAGLMLLQLFYGGAFYRGFLGKSGAKSYAKAVGASFLALLVWSVLSSSVIFLYNMNGFWGLLP